MRVQVVRVSRYDIFSYLPMYVRQRLMSFPNLATRSFFSSLVSFFFLPFKRYQNQGRKSL